MTSAPPNLLALRSLIVGSLPVSGNAVGIVGDPAHLGGYHCGRDRTVRGDYSVTESPRDSAGLCDYASALDVGQWYKDGHNLRTFSVWLVNECARGAADTRDIREIIYTGNGSAVKRWDREGRRSSGDSSHLWHTHVSFYRDATKDGRDLTPVFRRYVAYIGGTPAPAPAPLKLGDRLLTQGTSGPDVAEAQRLLNAHGARLTADGDFGPLTLAAVRVFQSAHGLEVDGVIGPKTIATLKGVPAPAPAPAPKPSPAPAPAPAPYAIGSRVLRRGAQGADVAELQRLLNGAGARLAVDGDFGPATEAAVTALQRLRGLAVDGVVGPQTLGALRTGIGARTLRRGNTGTDVAEIQRLLNARGYRLAVDGEFGPATDSAVRSFQRSRGLSVDGIAGPITLAALRK